MKNQQIWQDFDLNLTADDVLRGQGADPAVVRLRRPKLITAAEQALVIGAALLKPKAILEKVAVKGLRHEKLLLDGSQLTGQLIATQLGSAEHVTVIICTVGEEIQDSIRLLENTDMVLALALDGVANAAVDELSRQICTRLAEQASQANLKTSTPISPGSSNWPVEVGQPEIFSILDAQEIGVSLNNSALMYPRKSASFVVGIGKEMTLTDPCELCNLQNVCRFRQANAAKEL